jgi:hypothetical protein
MNKSNLKVCERVIDNHRFLQSKLGYGGLILDLTHY